MKNFQYHICDQWNLTYCYYSIENSIQKCLLDTSVCGIYNMYAIWKILFRDFCNVSRFGRFCAYIALSSHLDEPTCPKGTSISRHPLKHSSSTWLRGWVEKGRENLKAPAGIEN